jgi:hypothetical protein
MHRDQLESFIRQHRAEFDDASPPPDLWEKVERQLPRSRPLIFWRKSWLNVAAIGLLIIVAAGLGHYWGSHRSVVTDQALQAELSQAEQFYRSSIQQQYVRLSSQGVDPALETDLAEIDRAINEIRTEMQGLPPGTQRELTEKLINNYRIKLQLLEYVLQKQNQANPSKFYEHESSL